MPFASRVLSRCDREMVLGVDNSPSLAQIVCVELRNKKQCDHKQKGNDVRCRSQRAETAVEWKEGTRDKNELLDFRRTCDLVRAAQATSKKRTVLRAPYSTIMIDMLCDVARSDGYGRRSDVFNVSLFIHIFLKSTSLLWYWRKSSHSTHPITPTQSPLHSLRRK